MHPLMGDPLYEPCADLINLYQDCNAQTPFYLKVLQNACSSLHDQMSACMKEQRLKRQAANHEKSKRRQDEWQRKNREYALLWWENQESTSDTNKKDDAKPASSTE